MMVNKSKQLILILLFLFGGCNAAEKFKSVEVYGVTWNWTLMANYSPEELRENPSFIIRSSNKEFLEGFVHSLGLYDDFDINIPNNFSTVLVFDFITAEHVERYIANDEYFCSTSLKKCKKVSKSFKENFDILGVLNEE